MKKLERILTIGAFIVGIGLMGAGLYRCDRCPEKYLGNTFVMGAGLLAFTYSAGTTIREMYEENGKRL
ncbi:MAG TPA: hypothetical protein VMC80_01150 [Patescibacteria group bacterium]|nr:hypothetical protein [Patescibacteria group bacterium]